MKSATVQKHIKIQQVILLTLIGAAFVLFWDARLDLWAATKYFHPDHHQDHWFEQNQTLWTFFYHAAPWLTGILLLGSLVVLVMSQYKKWLQKYRIYAVFIFLSIALGPGLVINSVFKPYWGRPRPREVVELGGKYQYRPFYIPEVGAQGKSFPCGHCSVGFTYAVFFWIFLRRRKVLAFLSLAGSTIFGGLMGIGRIAAGGHFFSDVVWAGIISWSICFWLYYFVLRIPEREDGTLNQQDRLNWVGETIANKKPLAYSLYTVLGVLTVAALLLASPFYKEIELKAPTAEKIQNLKIQIDRGNIEFVQQTDLPLAFRIEGFAKGFGFPKNKVISECLVGASAVFLNCDIHRQGFFSDYESIVTIYINPNLIENFEFSLSKGDLDLRRASSLPANYKIQTFTYFK